MHRTRHLLEHQTAIRVTFGLCLLFAVVATEAVASIALARVEGPGDRCNAQRNLIMQMGAPCSAS